ncbi:hypothetical protein R1flu_008683 [Riccia fluitans]|uniref:Uncharacterized protein n=1 Tax=Riccia fluitans TaxID=41844 RepID=A0ABD1YCM7_9MARC
MSTTHDGEDKPGRTNARREEHREENEVQIDNVEPHTSTAHETAAFISIYKEPQATIEEEDHKERAEDAGAENARTHKYRSVVIPYSEEDEPS